jgi:hypothetical protein
MGQVDEFAELLREAKVNLAKRKLIRQRLIAGQEPLVGDEYVATISRHVTLRPIERVAEQPVRTNGVRAESYSYAD